MSASDVERYAVRLADHIGNLRPSAASRLSGHISACPLDDMAPGLTVGALAYLHNHPEHPMMELVDVTCPGIPDGQGGRKACPQSEVFKCRRFFSDVTVCDACHATYLEQERLAQKKKAWEHLCPPGFRDTDKAHAGFPKSQYEALRGWDGADNLVMYGPSGKGKTRLAMLLLKRAMLRGMVVGVLWPEKLRSLIQGYDNATFDHYAMYDVLLLDDPFITACRESKMVDAIKQLIDARMRAQKATLITTQVGTLADLSEGKEFGEAKAADLERLKAIIRRVSEAYKLVAFAEPVAAQGEAAF